MLEIDTTPSGERTQAIALIDLPDVPFDSIGSNYDHLPVVIDFRVYNFADSDFNFSRGVDSNDLGIWEAGFG
jgi:hypothetical protein